MALGKRGSAGSELNETMLWFRGRDGDPGCMVWHGGRSAAYFPHLTRNTSCLKCSHDSHFTVGYITIV